MIESLRLVLGALKAAPKKETLPKAVELFTIDWLHQDLNPSWRSNLCSVLMGYWISG